MPKIETSRQRARDERIQAHKQEDGSYIVYNPSSGSQYSLHKSLTGTWYCTCPFATKSGRVSSTEVCKHLARVLDKENGCTKCGTHGATLDKNRVCGPCKVYDRLG